MVEANYEWENDYTGPQTLRRQEYWTMLSGATGQLYGSRDIWPFAPGWKNRLNTIGLLQLRHLTSLFAPRRWYDLVPDQDHSLVTEGFGKFTDVGSVNDSDYLAAARTADGQLAMAYVPSGRHITVDLGRMTGAVRARWYDPSSGTFVEIADLPLDTVGRHDFETPGNNNDGDSDWVLVLETVG
jgi:hypothetical protein